MCRYNFLWGCCFISFGAGILMGLWLEGGFFCFCFALFMMILGYFTLKKQA